MSSSMQQECGAGSSGEALGAASAVRVGLLGGLGEVGTILAAALAARG